MVHALPLWSGNSISYNHTCGSCTATKETTDSLAAADKAISHSTSTYLAVQGSTLLMEEALGELSSPGEETDCAESDSCVFVPAGPSAKKAKVTTV